MARWFLFERQWRLFVEISKVQSDHFQQVRKQELLARFHQTGIVLTFLFSSNILIEIKPIGGTIKRDLQKKLGPITSLMDEISPPIYVVCGSLHKGQASLFLCLTVRILTMSNSPFSVNLWKIQPNLWKTQVWPNGPKICTRRTKTEIKDRRFSP